jgi:hypothetical protein
MMLAPLTSEVTGPGEAKRQQDALKRAKEEGEVDGWLDGAAPRLTAVPTELMDRLPESRAVLNSELTWLSDINDTEPGMMLFQLPSVLPIPAVAAGTAAAAENGGAGPSTAGAFDGRPSSLSELPSEKIGKFLVMRDGSVMAHIGGVYFEVSPGIPCKMHQEFSVVDPHSKEMTVLGELQRRVVVTPDLESLLGGEAPPLERAEADKGGKKGKKGFVVDLDSDEDAEEEEGPRGKKGKRGKKANGTAAPMEME